MKQKLKKISGVILIILGFFGGFVPIIQGWLLIVLGLALLESAFVDNQVRKLREWMKKFGSKK